ncbi:RNB domain-containing ribonuclease [Euzebya tangerina]|uniref:RNB domain-containing ribonuclease n=1 Tax=Euzebya tangerina TaxID=591198 RepID=UPI00196AF247|nr:RNB domain-containing ribonuclease [Euzebya tangerina]
MTLARRVLSNDAAAQSGADDAFQAVRDELDVPRTFSQTVIDAATSAAGAGPRLDREDRTDLELVTIDPPGSRDLDQAVVVLVGPGRGLVVHYAIADVAAFVAPGDPIDAEAWDRGVSRYSPDRVTPLHPPALSEGAASLIPGQDRPVVLWSLTLDASGELIDTHVRRAMVRSRAQLTYADAQSAIDHGTDPMLARLSRLGRLRAEREWVRGGVSLELPDQEVHRGADGHYHLRYRAPLPIEEWNAQVSLLTGIAAGQLMVEAGIGILRTLPIPDEQTIQGLRERAWALGLPWPPEVAYADFVRTLDPHEPANAAMISAAAVGLRGAGYVALDAQTPLPRHHRHEAIASVYAHVTAPLRRLVDRYASEVALAIVSGEEVPTWVTERLPDLPRVMAQARSRAAALDRAMTDLVEAQVLDPLVGQTFAGVAVRSTKAGTDVQLRDPAVITRTEAEVLPGTEVLLRLVSVDVTARQAVFVPV